MKGAEVARIQQAWTAEPGLDGWVWDGGHREKAMQIVDAPRVVQPP